MNNISRKNYYLYLVFTFFKFWATLNCAQDLHLDLFSKNTSGRDMRTIWFIWDWSCISQHTRQVSYLLYWLPGSLFSFLSKSFLKTSFFSFVHLSMCIYEFCLMLTFSVVKLSRLMITWFLPEAKFRKIYLLLLLGLKLFST